MQCKVYCTKAFPEQAEALFEKTEKGTPQGGNISPKLSNIMLNELDKELEKRGLQFVRYADDCVIFIKSKKSAERVMENITKFIETKLNNIDLSNNKISNISGLSNHLISAFMLIPHFLHIAPKVKL